jgi:hypothetical protein
MHSLILFLLLSSIAGAPDNPDEIVMVKSQPVIVQKSKRGVIHLDVEVKNGYHIQASKLKDELLIPTTLEIKQVDGFVIKRSVFPPSKQFQLEGTDSYLNVYDGQFEILLHFDIKQAICSGKYRLNGNLNYQACDSVRCLFPRTAEFFVDIEVK